MIFPRDLENTIALRGLIVDQVMNGLRTIYIVSQTKSTETVSPFQGRKSKAVL